MFNRLSTAAELLKPLDHTAASTSMKITDLYNLTKEKILNLPNNKRTKLVAHASDDEQCLDGLDMTPSSAHILDPRIGSVVVDGEAALRPDAECRARHGRGKGKQRTASWDEDACQCTGAVQVMVKCS